MATTWHLWFSQPCQGRRDDAWTNPWHVNLTSCNSNLSCRCALIFFGSMSNYQQPGQYGQMPPQQQQFGAYPNNQMQQQQMPGMQQPLQSNAGTPAPQIPGGMNQNWVPGQASQSAYPQQPQMPPPTDMNGLNQSFNQMNVSNAQPYMPPTSQQQPQFQPQQQTIQPTIPDYVKLVDPRVMSATIGNMPANSQVISRTGLPMGLMIRPLMTTPEPLPLVNFGAQGVVRCKVPTILLVRTQLGASSPA